jgi:UDPglucose 6-dehydrogenase
MAKIAFIGVGKLGQACAEMIAEHHTVKGYDIVPREPTNFEMSDTLVGAVQGSDFVFVAVPTPHDPKYDGSAPTSHLPVKDFDYTPVKQVLTEINTVIAPNQIVVLISTVLPGTVRRDLAPLITTGKLVYNPYLIAMGTVKWDMVNPEMVMIGTHDGSQTAEAAALVDFYETVMRNSPRYEIGTWEEIESLKVFYNTFISAKIGLVNMVQDVAERLGNMDAGRVCRALAASTRRISGPAYMTPGMGDSGACHPRDNIALRWLSTELDLGYDLFGEIMNSREVQAKNMAKTMSTWAKSLGNVPTVIVGKTYKPLVPYVDGSSSMLVAHYLEEMGHEVHYYDPILGLAPPPNLGPAVFLMAHDPETTYGEQLDHVHEFMRERYSSHAARAHLAQDDVRNGVDIAPGSVVIDPWRKMKDFRSDIRVVPYGNTRQPT